MPNIREYNSPQALQGIRPSELGVDALAQSGRRIASVMGQAGRDIGGGVASLGRAADEVKAKIDQHDAMQEISVGAAAYANLNSQLTGQWNDQFNKSDLNDHTIGDNFMSGVLEPALEKFQQGFSTEAGQKYALERTTALREHFGQKIAGDMSNRAADALGANAATLLNSSSNMARNDPSSMPFAMDQWESSLKAMAQNSGANTGAVSKVLTEQMEKGKAQIAQSAAIGMADKNPDALIAEINKGTFDNYMDGSQVKQMEAYARTQKNAQAQQFRLNSKDASDDYINQTYDPKTGLVKPVTAELFGQIMRDPKLTEPDKRSTVRFLQQQYSAQQREMNNEEHASDPQLLSSMRQRFASGDPRQYPTNEEIGEALGSGRLNSKDAGSLAKSNELLTGKTAREDPGTKDILTKSLASVHAQISGGEPPGSYTPAQTAAVARFDSWFWPAYQKAVANGMNPSALLSPDSPDYMLKPDTLEAFKIKGSDIVALPTNKLPPGPRPPLSKFFGEQPTAPKPPAKPMSDEEVLKAGGA